MKNFALIGAAGFVAPRHMKAVKETGNRIVCAVDPHDSVGVIDGYFPDAAFFTEFERFDRHVDKLRRMDPSAGGTGPVDYVSICSPNFLHDAHIRWALRSGADAVCEKPLVLNPWNAEALLNFEKENQKRVWNILQLRLHPGIGDVGSGKWDGGRGTGEGGKAKVNLTYIAPRGAWYYHSWKGDTVKSGGITTNIGIHFFDLVIHLFGPVSESYVHLLEPSRAAGFLELERAEVRWFLSLGTGDVRRGTGDGGRRVIEVDGKEIDLSVGMTGLHTESYRRILAGKGFGITDALPSIELAHKIRNTALSNKGERHELVGE